jgi:hypothetical protein
MKILKKDTKVLYNEEEWFIERSYNYGVENNGYIEVFYDLYQKSLISFIRSHRKINSIHYLDIKEI